jgi:FHA domain
MCTRCRLLYVLDVPPEPEPAVPPDAEDTAGPDRAPGEALSPGACPAPGALPPAERLALRMPWRQQINLPDEGEFVLGRSSPEFHAHPDASAAHQVSRRHARFYRDERGDLYVEDLNSANGTYIDGAPVEGRPGRLRSGQVLRLAQDVDCYVLRLNEHGEPEGD